MLKYSERASCKYLTHKYASFHGCTLEEMSIILGCYAIIEIPIMLFLSELLKQYLGFLGGLLLLFLFFSMLTFFVLMKKTAKKIGELRKGRPAGYLKCRFTELMHQYFGASMPYVIRSGRWSTRRRV